MDSILFWNDVALEANRISHTNDLMEQTGPTLSSRALAIVHLAVYDAYAAARGNPSHLPPYWAVDAASISRLRRAASPDSLAKGAVAGAAHTALSALFPGQRAFFDSRLSAAPGLNGGALNLGFHFGVGVARRLLLDRRADPDANQGSYVASYAIGRHREDPDNPRQGYHAPFYGAGSKGFAITRRHELCPPPFRDRSGNYSNEYVEALREVRRVGVAPELSGTLPRGFNPRIAEEMVVGIYWGYDGVRGIGTPPRLYNQIVRQVATKRGSTEDENARLLALINVAMGDAGILAWDQKYIHEFWRPVVGIREHGLSMGVAEVSDERIFPDADPGWLPLGAPATNSLKGDWLPRTTLTYPFNQALVALPKNFTPNFPAYPSGHATFGAAAFHIARLFFGVPPGDRKSDNILDGLDFVSDEFNGINQDNRGTVRPRHVRRFPEGLWQMIEQNGRSRVYLGVHWLFDAFAVNADNKPALDRNIGGVPLGLTIAEDIYESGMVKSRVPPRGEAVPDVLPDSDCSTRSNR